MTEPAPPLVADVLLDERISPDQEVQLRAALAAAGVVAHTRVVPPRRVIEQLQWLVLVALPLHGFLSGVGARLADDGYLGLKRLTGVLRGIEEESPAPAPAPQNPPSPLVLQDEMTGLKVILEHDLPDSAYAQLLGLDFSRFRFGPLHFDRLQDRWRSELDEAAEGRN